MAAPSPPRALFLAWWLEASFLCLWRACLVATSLHMYQVLRYCEITQTQCSRPYGTATCILQTAMWLGTCQSTWTQVERSSELLLVCHRISPFCPATAWPVGPMSLEWPLTQPEGHVQPGHAPLHEDANSDRLGNTPRGPPHQRRRRDVLQPPVKCPGVSLPGTRVCTFRLAGGQRCVSWNTRGLLGSTASPQRSSSCKLTTCYTLNSECLVPSRQTT